VISICFACIWECPKSVRDSWGRIRVGHTYVKPLDTQIAHSVNILKLSITKLHIFVYLYVLCAFESVRKVSETIGVGYALDTHTWSRGEGPCFLDEDNSCSYLFPPNIQHLQKILLRSCIHVVIWSAAMNIY